MSVGLKLLPFYLCEAPFSLAVIPLESVSPEFIEAVSALPLRDCPEKFNAYLGTNAEGETCYGEVSQDMYGENLRYARAGDLLTVQIDDVAFNRAAWAYLAALPTDHKIALFWD